MSKVAFFYSGYESIGVEYLSSCLKENGHEVRLFFDPVLFDDYDMPRIRPLSKLLDARAGLLKNLFQYDPDLTCFSVVTDDFQWAKNLAIRIKDSSTTKIVFGGIHSSTLPEKLIRERFIDFVCVGEGEEALVELADQVGSKRHGYNTIKNIYYKRNGNVYMNDVRPLIQNLDSIPFPDKDLFYGYAPIFNHGYYIITSRGCPYSCGFCGNYVWRKIYRNKGTYFRRRSIENVMDELRMAVLNHKPEYVYFFDDNMLYDEKWLKNFFKEYKKNICLPFFCNSSPEFITRETAKVLKEANCFKIEIGVQTTDNKLNRNFFNRIQDKSTVAEAINILKDTGIYVFCDNIFNVPGQRFDDLVEYLQFYHLNTPDSLEVLWLRYYPKTFVFERANERGLFDSESIKSIEDGNCNSGIRMPNKNDGTLFKRVSFWLSIFYILPYWFRAFLLKNRAFFAIPIPFSFMISRGIRFLVYLKNYNKKWVKYGSYFHRMFKKYQYYITRQALARFKNSR